MWTTQRWIISFLLFFFYCVFRCHVVNQFYRKSHEFTKRKNSLDKRTSNFVPVRDRFVCFIRAVNHVFRVMLKVIAKITAGKITSMQNNSAQWWISFVRSTPTNRSKRVKVNLSERKFCFFLFVVHYFVEQMNLFALTEKLREKTLQNVDSKSWERFCYVSSSSRQNIVVVNTCWLPEEENL